MGGLRTKIYSNSLVLVMGFIFFASWFGSAATGWTAYNAQQDEHKQRTTYEVFLTALDVE